jgi:hypothetical protein
MLCYENWSARCDRLVQSARDAGSLVHLPIYLNALGMSTAWRGEFATAGSLIAEADAIVDATSVRFARYAAVLLAGLRGNEADATALIGVMVSRPASFTPVRRASRGTGLLRHITGDLAIAGTEDLTTLRFTEVLPGRFCLA